MAVWCRARASTRTRRWAEPLFRGTSTACRQGKSDGLVLSNVPPECNTLDALNRHFRSFGEVLKITSQVHESKAYVQFATRAAAEAAVQVPVLDRPEINFAGAFQAASDCRYKAIYKHIDF